MSLDRQLTKPLMLATHGYHTPYDALRDKTQSILTQIVAHREFFRMSYTVWSKWIYTSRLQLHGQAALPRP